MSDSLLPPNRSRLERNAEQATARLGEANAPFESLWDAWACPANLLPWLAWALGVRQWSHGWSEERKRQAVESALRVRRYAGTVGAVREAMTASQVTNMRLEEWFDYAGEPGHFRLSADLTGVGISQAEFRQLVNFVLRAKRLSAHWDGIRLSSITRGNVTLASTQQASTTGRLRPFQPRQVTAAGTHRIGVAHHTGTGTRLRPFQPRQVTTAGPTRLGLVQQTGTRATVQPWAPPRVELAHVAYCLGITNQGSSYATLMPG